MHFEWIQIAWWQWALAFGGAFFIGLAKTGIPGVGIFAVAMFAMVIEPKESVGLVLPLLILGDVVAVKTYHRHAIWSHLWRLMPWAVVGIIIGYFTAGHLNAAATGKLMGVILVAMVVLHLWRKRVEDEHIPDGIVFAAFMGLLAGFTTMIANAAGPIMIMYLLAMRLPKMAFIGTGAWYYFILNSFKVPFQWELGSITNASLLMDAALAPFVIGGAFWGRAVLPKINQQLFENVALAFTVIAGLKLLFF
jgi:uncharacterized membrane protein YfcA